MSLAAIIARAAPPPERVGDGPFEPVAMDAVAWARRRARLSAAFGSPERLAVHADALGLAPEAWLDRFRDVRLVGPPPDWAHAFGSVFERLSDGVAPYAEVRRWAGAEAAARWPADLPRGPDALEGPLDQLAGRLGMALQPTLYLEAGLRANPGWAARFQRSPALAYAVGRIVADWLSDVATITARAAADRAVLSRAVFEGADPGALTGIECGLGDPHAGGRSVAVLRFERGPVVYKPKDLRIADAVGEIAGLLGDAGLAPPGRVSCNGYAWERLCEAHTLADESEADAFFRALGGWLALLQPFGAIDFWFDNLIAEGMTPRFVDFETAVQPPMQSPTHDLRALSGCTRAMLEASPLGVGILPALFPLRDGEDPTDIGCMARPGEHRMPLSAPGRSESMSWHEDRFAPRLAGGASIDAADYFEAFEEGYFRAANALASPTLSARVVETLQAAGDATVRIILIDTWTCYRAINASLAPRHLADGVWREIFLHAVLRERAEMIGALREAAVRDLRRLDIPLFQTRLSSRDLSGCEGECRPGFFEQDAVSATRERLRTLAAMARDERAAWLRSGFGLRAGNPPWRSPSRAALAPAKPGDLLAWADEIATGIVRHAVADGGKPTWIGRYHDVFTGMQGVGPLGFDILSGRAGLALALRELARRLNRRDLSELVSDALSGTAQDYLDHIELNLTFGAGYVVGGGGLVAALAQVPGLHGLAEKVFQEASSREIWLRSGGDYVSGLAGWREAVKVLDRTAPSEHGTGRAYAPSARTRLARWLAEEKTVRLCPDRRAAARLRHDRDRHGSWFAALWLDDRHHLSGIDGTPALALAFARLAEDERAQACVPQARGAASCGSQSSGRTRGTDMC